MWRVLDISRSYISNVKLNLDMALYFFSNELITDIP